MGKFSCKTCSKCFTTNSNLLRHERAVHIFQTDEPVSRFACKLCNYTSSRPDALKAHETHAHETHDHKNCVSCAMCEFQCSRKAAMVEHYKSDHGINIVKDNFEFLSLDEFNSWKRRVEVEEQHHYIQVRGVRRTADECNKITYSCFRDGKSNTRATQRDEKMLGSNKIGAHCPARMEVTTHLGKVEVSFFKTHVGHTQGIGRFRICPPERTEIVIDAQKDSAHQNLILSELSKSVPSTSQKTLDELREEAIQNVTSIINNKVKSLEDLEVVNQMLETMEMNIDALNSMNTCIVPCEQAAQSNNSNVEPQRPFVKSIKRQKRAAFPINKPTTEEAENIAVRLLLKK